MDQQRERKQMMKAVKSISSRQTPTYVPPQTVEKMMKPGQTRTKDPVMLVKEEDDRYDFVKRRKEQEAETQRKMEESRKIREKEREERQKILQAKGVKTIIPAEPVRPKTVTGFTGQKKKVVETRHVVKVVRSGQSQMGPSRVVSVGPKMKREEAKREPPKVVMIDTPTTYIKFKERTAAEKAKDLTAKHVSKIPNSQFMFTSEDNVDNKRERDEHEDAQKIDALFEEIEGGREIALVTDGKKRTKIEEIEDAREIDALFGDFEEKEEKKEEKKEGGGRKKNKQLHLM